MDAMFWNKVIELNYLEKFLNLQHWKYLCLFLRYTCVVAAVVGIFGCNQCSSIFSQSRPTHLAGYEFVRRRVIIIRRHGR